MDLTEAQWAILRPLLEPKRRPDGRGRPWRDARAVLNGILWILRTGAPWHDLPNRYPPYQTCHRRFQPWQRDGTRTRLLHRLAEELRNRGKIDLSETFIDASFSAAKKRGTAVGPTRRGKGSKIMAIADCHGLPIACGVASASPFETQLVEATLQQRFTRAKPERMIGDAAYDSDRLDRDLRRNYRIRMIAPNHRNRGRKTQDGRALRCYCRHGRIERLFGWLHNFRRQVTRREYSEADFLAMIQLGGLKILLRHS